MQRPIYAFAYVLCAVLLGNSSPRAFAASAPSHQKKSCIDEALAVRSAKTHTDEMKVALFEQERRCLKEVEKLFSKGPLAKSFANFIKENPSANDEGNALGKFIHTSSILKDSGSVGGYITAHPLAYRFDGFDSGTNRPTFSLAETYEKLKTLSSKSARSIVFIHEIENMPNLCHARYDSSWHDWTETACNEAIADKRKIYEKYTEFGEEARTDLKKFVAGIQKISVGGKLKEAKTRILKKAKELSSAIK